MIQDKHRLRTIFMWDFENEYEDYHHYFDPTDMPRLQGEVLEEVFV